MKTLIAFELRKNKKSVMSLALVTGAMVFFSMLFFPTISENLNMLGDFLNSGFMQGIMTAFNVDVFAMRALLGFFAGYCTMWVVLLGSVFFGYLGSEWIAKEERTGTIEFLLSKPLTRRDIYLSKTVALILFSLVFMFIVGLVGFVGMSMQFKVAPYEVYMEYYNDSIESTLLENADNLKPYTVFSEEDLQKFVSGMLMKQFTDNKEEIKASGIDAELIMDKLKGELSNPEKLFEKMRAEPESYMELLGVKGTSAENFKLAIEEETKNYSSLKKTFLSPGLVLEELYKMEPTFFLNHWTKSGQIEEVDRILNHKLLGSGLISKLDYLRYGVLLLKMFLVVFINGILGLCFAAFSKDSAASSQRVMIVVLVLYFMNSLSEMNSATSWIHYLTPFGYVDTSDAFLRSELLILVTIFSGIWWMAMNRYEKKDFV